jgi:hypothetical protein
MTADPRVTGLPAVSDSEAIDDADWFEANPRRLFRARRVNGGYTVIRHTTRGVFLRVCADAGAAIVDVDCDLALLWFSSAHPTAHPEQVRKRALKALKQGGKK